VSGCRDARLPSLGNLHGTGGVREPLRRSGKESGTQMITVYNLGAPGRTRLWV